MFLDLGTALAKGYETYNQAKTQEEQKRMLAQQFKMQMQNAQLQQQQMQDKDAILKTQLQQLKDQLFKQHTWQVLDAYNQSNGDINYINKFLQSDPYAQQVFGAIRVEKINPETDDKALLAQGINPELVSKNPFRFIKAIGPDGSVHYVDMTGIYGMTGYTQYKTQQDLELLKQKLMLSKVAGIDPQLQKYQELYTKVKELGSLDKLPPQEQAEYLALSKKYNFAPTNLDKATEATDKGTEVSLNLQKALNDPKQLQTLLNDKNFIEQARRYQILTGKHMLQGDRKYYLDSLSMMKKAYKILDELSKLKENDVAKGPMDEGLQTLRTYFTSDKLKDMTPEERLKFIKSIEMNTKVGLLVKQYLLAMSGQGVTDEEYKRVRTILEGGDFANLPALKAALGSFYDYKKNSLLGRLQAEAMTYPADTIDILKPYSKYLYGNWQMNPNTMNIENSGYSPEQPQPNNTQPNQKEQVLQKYMQLLNQIKVK